MKEFIKTEKNGTLYMDRILFEASYPILFSCKNEKEDIFICVCCQNNAEGQKWLIGKTNALSIIRMLKDEITIRELLIKNSEEKITVDLKNGIWNIEYNNNDWKPDSIYLPKEDSYIDAEPEEFEEDINYYISYSRKNTVHYKTNMYKNIVEKTEIINKEMVINGEFIASALSSYNSNEIISSQIMHTMQIIEEACINMKKVFQSYVEDSNFESLYEGYIEQDTKEVSIELKEEVTHNLARAA